MMHEKSVSRRSKTIRVITESVRMQLLLIEDDPALQLTLHRTLERKGISVALCSDGRLAVERWKKISPTSWCWI